jgi:hypothetical protein
MQICPLPPSMSQCRLKAANPVSQDSYFLSQTVELNSVFNRSEKKGYRVRFFLEDIWWEPADLRQGSVSDEEREACICWQNEQADSSPIMPSCSVVTFQSAFQITCMSPPLGGRYHQLACIALASTRWSAGAMKGSHNFILLQTLPRNSLFWSKSIADSHHCLDDKRIGWIGLDLAA